jgi:hypothetical protein
VHDLGQIILSFRKSERDLDLSLSKTQNDLSDEISINLNTHPQSQARSSVRDAMEIKASAITGNLSSEELNRV